MNNSINNYDRFVAIHLNGDRSEREELCLHPLYDIYRQRYQNEELAKVMTDIWGKTPYHLVNNSDEPPEPIKEPIKEPQPIKPTAHTIRAENKVYFKYYMDLYPDKKHDFIKYKVSHLKKHIKQNKDNDAVRNFYLSQGPQILKQYLIKIQKDCLKKLEALSNIP